MQIVPSDGLKVIIRHFLIYHPSTSNSVMTFFSDGNPGIVVPLSYSRLPFLHNQKLQEGELIAYGLMEHPIIIPPPPACGIIVIVLQPYALAFLSGIKPERLKNCILPLSALFGLSASFLQMAIRGLNDEGAIIKELERFFFNLLSTLPPTDELLRESLYHMKQSNGKISIQELLRGLFVSERLLERRFDRFIGISPKKLNGILRINHYLKLLRDPNHVYTPVQAAIEAGFYDQAHLNNKFKEITSTSPLKYLASLDPLAMNLFSFRG
ncbi:AraC-like DNA-binding protein [Pedobacter cryoconitis]|uniref:AraC-like DNA-binding protein n=1 Tax=Pedobacter cryoconitis TaxID=188932 RepID=A0A7W8YU97_9SPHI|nr:helix-turn-helix domain-containing protein [Pedobacter cryoconitis]MBB5621911.1 AraC-like DNA-binding protein [Pedobacter cryoconitis]